MMTTEEREEQVYFEKCIKAFTLYHKHAIGNVNKALTDFGKLSERHQQLLPNYRQQQADVIGAINANYKFIHHLIRHAGDMFSNQVDCTENGSEGEAKGPIVTQGDMERVYTTLRQFVRDWSVEGVPERDKCYKPILQTVEELYPNKEGVSVLVPGAGLGRLAFDFAQAGYSCEGNEFSIFMLIGSNYMLNQSLGPQTIHPWANTAINNLSHTKRLMPVSVPDVDTSQLSESVKFSMSAGDFLEVYEDIEAEYDVVAASFFMDTAHNIIEYLECIYKVLKPGGRLISLGPLLYHYTNMSGQLSIELSWEDLAELIPKMGFTLDSECTVEDVPYIKNVHSMSNMNYSCKMFVARKPLEADIPADLSLI